MAVSLSKSSDYSISYDSSTIQGALGYGHSYSAGTNIWELEYTSPQQALEDRVADIESRLLIIKADEILQNKYPALKEAYDHYKLVEKLVKGE